jgi:hypothetical protein
MAARVQTADAGRHCGREQVRRTWVGVVDVTQQTWVSAADVRRCAPDVRRCAPARGDVAGEGDGGRAPDEVTRRALRA